MFNKNFKYKDLSIALIVAGILILIGSKVIDTYPYFLDIINKFLSLCTPFIYGLIIAYILNPIVKLFKRRLKLNEGMAVLATYALLLGLVSLILVYCIPNFVQSIIDLTKDIPGYITDAQNWLNDMLKDEKIKDVIMATGTMDSVNKIISQVGTVAVSLLEGSISYIFSVSGQLVKVVLGLLISVYVSIDKDRFIREIKRILFITVKPNRANKIIELVRTLNKMIGTYIGIKAIDSSIIAGMAFVLLTLVNSEYTLLLTFIVGVTNMIPYFGPLIGELFGLLFNVFISPAKGIVVFLVLLCLQLFDGWYLDPKLIGGKVGLRPFIVIFSVVTFGGFFGPVGMLLASPVAATIKIYYDRKMRKNHELIKLADEA